MNKLKVNRSEIDAMQMIMKDISQSMLVVISEKNQNNYYVPSERKYSKTAIKRKILTLREMLLELSKDVDEHIYY